jgi:pyruvate formate lyase activating enzyme
VAQAEARGCRSISFTYTEPTIFFEYAYDIARQATSAGLSTVFVTNGYMTGEALTTIAPVLDAASVDLKAFSENVYREFSGARLQPVLDTLERMRDLDLWVEITTLIVPDVNDDASQLRSLATFIADALGHDTPWHISRFFPAYRMSQAEPTPVATLRNAARIGAEAGLRYVYTGHVDGHASASTVCPSCGAWLIERSRFDDVESRVTQTSTCPTCGAPVAGVELAPSGSSQGEGGL